MSEDQPRSVLFDLFKNAPNPEVSILYIIKALARMSEVVDGIAHDVHGTGAVPGATGSKHPHSDALADVREDIDAALKAIQGKLYGGQ